MPINPYESLDSQYRALEAIFESLINVANEVHQGEIANRAQATLGKLRERVFRIAIAGEFSTGKSTLINALLGAELLPTALEACTAVVTRIRTANLNEEAGIYVTFQRSGQRKIKAEELRATLTFAGQSGDDRAIQANVLLSQSTFLDNGIEIIDTPGVNDPEARGEEITLSFLPKADAIIFITHAARAFKESEVEFLRDRIGDQDRDRVLFAVNACDIIEETEDRDDLRTRGEELLGENYNSPLVHMISARDGLAAKISGSDECWNVSGMSSFLSDIDRLLTRERGAQELRRYQEIAFGLHSKMKRRVEEEIDDLGLDEKVRERRVSHIQETLSFLKSEEQKVLESLDTEFTQIRVKLERTIDRELSGLERQLSGYGSKRKEGQENDVHGRAQKSVSACGKRTLTRVQSAMRSDISRIQKELAGQITQSLGKADHELSGQTTNLVVENPGFDNLVTVYTDRSVEEHEVVDRVETQMARESSTGEAVVKGAAYGLLASYVIAPWAAIPMGLLIGLGSHQNRSQSQKIYKKVKEYFVTQSVDANQAVVELRERLLSVSEQAIETLKGNSTSDVKNVFSTKASELRQRMTELNEPTREEVALAHKRSHAEQQLNTISQISLTSEVE